MGVTRIRERIAQLRQERGHLEDALRKRGKMIPGAVIERHTEWGRQAAGATKARSMGRTRS